MGISTKTCENYVIKYFSSIFLYWLPVSIGGFKELALNAHHKQLHTMLNMLSLLISKFYILPPIKFILPCMIYHTCIQAPQVQFD